MEVMVWTLMSLSLPLERSSVKAKVTSRCVHVCMCAHSDVRCHLLPCVLQMAIMFMKIDTNCDGTVDWDEFCTYMLLEYQEKDSMTRGGRMPYPHPLRTVTRQVLCRLGVWHRRVGRVPWGVAQEGGAWPMGCGTGGRGVAHGLWHRREGRGPWGVAQEGGAWPMGCGTGGRGMAHGVWHRREGHGPWGVAQEGGAWLVRQCRYYCRCSVSSPHREVLSAVRHMPTAPQTAADHSVAVSNDGGRYITAGQDGCVCVWKSNLSLTRTIQVRGGGGVLWHGVLNAPVLYGHGH